jgi:hypothetical protein
LVAGRNHVVSPEINPASPPASSSAPWRVQRYLVTLDASLQMPSGCRLGRELRNIMNTYCSPKPRLCVADGSRRLCICKVYGFEKSGMQRKDYTGHSI